MCDFGLATTNRGMMDTSKGGRRFSSVGDITCLTGVYGTPGYASQELSRLMELGQEEAEKQHLHDLNANLRFCVRLVNYDVS